MAVSVEAVAGAVAVTEIVEIVPAVIAGDVQLTVAVPVHVQPAGGVAETDVTPAGIVIVTMFVVAAAVAGPRFFT